MKYILLLLLFFMTFIAHSQSISLVEKDKWGSSSYADVIQVDDYIYALSQTGQLDILDPNKSLNQQLISHFDFLDNKSGSDLAVYKGFLSITAQDKIVFYDITDPIAPVNVFEFSIDYDAYLTQKIIDDDYIYVLSKKKLYIINYLDSAFKIKQIHTLDDLSSNTIRRSKMNIEQGHLFIHQVEEVYSDDYSSSTYNYVINEYDLNDIANVSLISKVEYSKAGFNAEIEYLGQSHFALTVDNKVQIIKAEKNVGSLVSEIDVDTYIYSLHWQQDLKKLNIISQYNWYSSQLNSFSAPTLEVSSPILRKNRIYKIYHFISDNLAIADAVFGNETLIVNLNNPTETTALFDQSGGISDVAIINNNAYVLKTNKVHALSFENSQFKYNYGISGNDLDDVFIRSLSANGEQFYIDSNNRISVFNDNSDSTTPSFDYDVSVPTENYISTSISNDKYKVILEHATSVNSTSSTQYIHWYNAEEPYSLLIPPSSFDISSYKLDDDHSLEFVHEMYFVGDYLAVIGTTEDRKMYLLLIENNGQSIDLVDYLYVDSSNWANFFVNNDKIYQMIRYENKITEFEISDNDKLTEIQSYTISLGSNHELYNGLIFDDYLLLQEDNYLKLFDFKNVETNANLDLVGEINVASNYSHKLVLENIGNKLLIGDGVSGVLTLFELNRAPTFELNQIETEEDMQSSFTNFATDYESDDIKYGITENAINGLVTLSNDQHSILYLPNPNYYGDDRFVLKATDIHGNFSEKEIAVKVTPTEDEPNPENDATTINFGDVASDSLATTDIDGQVLSYSIVTDVNNGI
ncbi:MAG: hypothetical protein HRT52_16080 [Colwellia sp.]|nr:hypothetical protein [Colwellia sp.]